VVRAEVEERRLAVLRGRVARHLDADDVAPADALVGKRDGLHEARVAHGELLELSLVVGQPPVLRAPAGKGGLVAALGPRLVGAPVRAVLRLDVLHLDVVRVARRLEGDAVVRAVQDDVDAAGTGVLRAAGRGSEEG
jgi:hypothetical protein